MSCFGNCGSEESNKELKLEKENKNFKNDRDKNAPKNSEVKPHGKESKKSENSDKIRKEKKQEEEREKKDKIKDSHIQKNVANSKEQKKGQKNKDKKEELTDEEKKNCHKNEEQKEKKEEKERFNNEEKEKDLKKKKEIISIKDEKEKDKEVNTINTKGVIENKNINKVENEGKNIKRNDFKNNFEEFHYKKDIYGFQNSKNNCYLNSSLQLLTRVTGLREGIFDFNKKCDINKNSVTGGNLFKEFKNILDDIEKNQKIIIPDYLKEEMGRIDERYNHNRQEDANEFISNFLDALREETSEKDMKKIYININNFSDELEMMAYKKFYSKFYERKGYSFLLDLFYGNYITKKFCKRCRKILSVKFNAFNMIELPIYELAKVSRYSLNIDDILKSFFSESKIYGAKCDKCNEEEVYSKTSIYKLPENLIIFFGRTANEQYIDNKINYTQTLDLNLFLHPKSNSKFNSYNLSGIIHYTSFGKKGVSGHYTASCLCHDGWYHFDDTLVSKIYSADSNEIILFYEKLD